MPPPAILLDDLGKQFETSKARVHAVNGVSLAVEPGTWVTLLGPSGCGKTTILRMVAGLETPTSGQVSIDGELAYSKSQGINVSAHRRPIGMVFQSYALWPHMTVIDNVMFPLQVSRPRIAKKEIRRRALEALDLVDLPHVAQRQISALSGGQQQRVALARALVREPKVLLLDEPLSNLDASLRQRIGADMRALQKRTGVTTLFVTHDQSEALAMSDQILLLREGKVIQAARPEELFENPKDMFAADFMGVSNVIACTVTGTPEANVSQVSALGAVVRCRTMTDIAPGGEARLVFRPEDVRISAWDPQSTAGGEHGWRGTIRTRIYQGAYTDYEIELEGGHLLRARQSKDRQSTRNSELEVGSAAIAFVEPEVATIFATA